MNFLTLNRKTDATVEPVTLEEAKAHLHVTMDNEDTYIESLITVARQAVEDMTRRSLVTQTWEAGFEGWPNLNPARPEEYGFKLPRPKAISVESVVYWDEDGVERTMDEGDYVVDVRSFPAILRVKRATPLPTLSKDLPAPVLITYVAGFGNADAVPAPIKQAILLTVSHHFEVRSPVSTSAFTRVPGSAQALLGPYKLRLI